MTVSIHQPNFLPWIGYFHKVINSDKFVLLDDVQFPIGDTFCNRTKIKTNLGEEWLTVPVKNRSNQILIKDILIDENNVWKRKILKKIKLSYQKSDHFDDVYPMIESIIKKSDNYLFNLNYLFLEFVFKYLNIKTTILLSSEIEIANTLNGLDKIISILNSVGATNYLSGSGSGSKRYIDEEVFKQNCIILRWQNYKYKNYNQLHGSFLSNLSIIDLLFNHGTKSFKHIE